MLWCGVQTLTKTFTAWWTLLWLMGIYKYVFCHIGSVHQMSALSGLCSDSCCAGTNTRMGNNPITLTLHGCSVISSLYNCSSRDRWKSAEQPKYTFHCEPWATSLKECWEILRRLMWVLTDPLRRDCLASAERVYWPCILVMSRPVHVNFVNVRPVTNDDPLL